MLQQFGSPVDLKERPSNLFVAGFIGEPPMNLLEAQVAAEGGAIRVVVQNEQGSQAFSFVVPSRPEAAPLQNGRRIQVGIRPHKIVVAPTGNGALERVTGTVVSSQWLGDQSYLGVEIGDAFLILVADRSIRAAHDSQITLGLPYEALHFFDPDTGKAVLHGSDLKRA